MFPSTVASSTLGTRGWRAGRVACVAGAVVALASAHGLRAQVPGELRGRVVDARTARGVAEARVDVDGRSIVAMADAEGTFVLRGLEPRTYTVRVRALGYAAHELEATVANGRATTLNVMLVPVATSIARVVVRAARAGGGGGAVTTFDRRAVEASGRRDVGELLQAVPGVVVTSAGGPGASSQVSIRGSSANEVLVLIDGVPLNSTISGAADLSRVALETVERVTVHTGAQSARYGPRALAGVIEIETRRAEDDVSALVRTGAWGERNGAATLGATHALGTQQVGGSLTGDYRTVDGDFRYDVPDFRGGGTARRLNAGVTSRALVGGLTLDGPSAGARLRGEWQSTDRGLAGSIVQPSLTGHQDDTRRSAGLDLRAVHRRLSWTATGDATAERVAFADTAPPFGVRYDESVRATSLTALASGTLDLGALSASAGGEARRLGVRSTMITAAAPVVQRLYGVWGAARFERPLLTPGTELHADVAMRLDWSTLLSGATASPRASVGLSHGLVTATASAGAGYTPPSLADQFFHEGVLVRANPALRPERVRADVEGRVALHDARAGALTVGGEAAVFHANVDGMILWLPDFRYVWSPTNYDVRRSGWEVSGQAALPAAGVDVQGTLDQTDVVYAGPVLTGQVAYRPRTTASVTAAATRRGVRLEVVNRYAGARRTVLGSPLNMLDPYWRTDARLGASIVRAGWHVDGTIGLENVLDQSAAMLVDYPFPSRSWTLAVRARRTGAPRTNARRS